MRAISHLVRPHILAIAAFAALTFGWVFAGVFDATIPILVAIDWFVVNFVNRAVDLAEDERNGVAGIALMARHARAFTIASWVLMFAALGIGALVSPRTLVLRTVFHLIGIAYNHRVIPAPRGFTRFKELYLAKNGMSGVLFVISVIIEPIVHLRGSLTSLAAAPILVAIVFFFTLEITFEIVYDLRDIAGDSAENVPTFPVVHGAKTAEGIILVLLAISAITIAGAWLLGIVPRKLGVMVAAPIQQAIFLAWRVRGRTPTQDDCVLLTWLGAAQLASYDAWVALGLPLGG